MMTPSRTMLEMLRGVSGLRQHDQAEPTGGHQKQTLELLTEIVAGTAVATGEDFFHALVRHLAAAFQVRHAMVTVATEVRGHVRTLAHWAGDRFLQNYEYDVAGTPCEPVLLGETRQYVHSIREYFPGSESLAEYGIESYLSIPLAAASGEILGNLVVMDDKPMPEKPRDLPILQIFAARAVAELERLRTDEELRKVANRLSVAEKMAALCQIAACVAHEVNSPLGAIRSNTDVSFRALDRLHTLWEKARPGDEAVEGEFQRCFDTLRESTAANATASTRMGSIVKSLEKLTELDEGEYELVDMREGIEYALGLVRGQLGDRVKVVKRFDEVPRIRAYPLELSQVFVTLLTNAAEAIDQTGTITLSTVADGSDVFVTVADSGRGIPNEELETLFDIGFVKKGPRVRMRLGLANAYNIIKKHGGELDVLSAVGRGTEFTLKLPIN